MSVARDAVVLLSGGLDSATALAIARRDGFVCHALSFRYGQRHAVELQAARRIAEVLGAASHQIVDVDLRAFGGSALTDDAIAVPKGRAPAAMTDDIPTTYVPARNTLFLSYALALAEVRGARAIVIGANAIDYSGYPDCRPEYLDAFERLANLATRMGVQARSADEQIRVLAPLLRMTKAEIIRAGAGLGVDFGQTWSCYDPVPSSDGPRACGRCDSCVLRRKGFVDADVADPTRYA